MFSKKVNETLDRFSDYIRNGQAAFFIGAGVSNPHPSHLPLAGQVSEALVRNIYRNSHFLSNISPAKRNNGMTENELVNMLLHSQGHEVRFECLMQLVLDTVGDLKILNVFKRQLPNHNHYFLTEALASGNQVVTVNFDKLIETAYSSKGTLDVSTIEGSFRSAKKSSAKKRILFKIHGTLESEESIRATVRQVGRSGLAFMWEPGKAQFLERLVQSRYLIFMGYSGADDLDIMSKLSITEFSNQVLWVKHAACKATWVRPNMYQREFDDEMLLHFLKNHNVSVLKADTDTVTRELWSRSLDTTCLVPMEKVLCKCKHKDSYLSIIRDSVNKWRSRNPGMIDFLAARLLYEAGFPRESLDVLKRLEVLFQKIQDDFNYSRTLINMGTIEEDIGLYDDAIQHHEVACLLLSARGDSATWCNSSINLAVLHMRQGNLMEAESDLMRVIKVSKHLGLQSEYARACSNLAAVLRRVGQYKRAKNWLKQAYRIYKSLGDHAGCAVVFSSAGEITFAQEGDAEAAEVLFRMAMEEAKRMRNSIMIAKLWLNLGAVYIRRANAMAARKAYHEAACIAESSGHKQYLTLSKIGLCKVALSLGHLTKAIAEGKRLIGKAKRIGLHDQVAELKGNIALALMDKGKHREALRYFHAAKRDFQTTVRAPELLAFTFQNIGQCHLGLGNKAKSAENLQKALSIYKELGLKHKVNEVRNFLSSFQ